MNTDRPRLLDLGCCAGAASRGYADAGFDVWGVDLTPRGAYPYTLVRADMLDVLRDRAFLALFAAIHASPPCQANTRLQHLRNAQGGSVKENGHDMIGPVRELLGAWGRPYVIENVPGADMRADLTLCGTMFGLHVMRGDRYRPLKRHRLFESNVDLGPQPSCDHTLGRPLGVYGTPADDIPAGGQTCSSVREAGELMGIGWMTRWDDIKEAIPPAYTRHVGERLMAAVRER